MLYSYYLDPTTNKYKCDVGSKFNFDNKYKISKCSDYSDFISQITELKKKTTLTVKDSGVNPESSRGFSYVIVPIVKNGKTN